MKGLPLKLSVLRKNLGNLDPKAVEESMATISEAIEALAILPGDEEREPKAEIVRGDGVDHLSWYGDPLRTEHELPGEPRPLYTSPVAEGDERERYAWGYEILNVCGDWDRTTGFYYDPKDPDTRNPVPLYATSLQAGKWDFQKAFFDADCTLHTVLGLMEKEGFTTGAIVEEVSAYVDRKLTLLPSPRSEQESDDAK